MTAIAFLAEWAVRSAVLILGGALLVWVLRVKNASIRLAASTAMLCGSVAIPAMTAALPKLPFVVMRAPAPVVVSATVEEAAPMSAMTAPAIPVVRPFDWVRAALLVYAMGAGALLLRLGVGLAMSMRLRRGSRATGEAMEGIEIRESELLGSPVALGIVRPVILLPIDWRQWDGVKWNAVLMHERSHIRRCDPAVQVLSATHRALLWFSPLSWLLHQRLVRLAEEASDDAALASSCDRALYAKALLEFMQRGVRRAGWLGVPMARYGQPDQRIHRILDGAALSRGVTRGSVAAILALGLPLAYLVAAAWPIHAQAIAPQGSPVPAAAFAQRPAAEEEAGTGYLRGLGSVEAYTVTIKPRVDGQLMSVNFKEGEVVQTGQVLVTIDPRPYELQLQQAEGEVTREEAHYTDALLALKGASKDQRVAQFGSVAELEGRIKIAQSKVREAQLQLEYTKIVSPITGVAGLRIVDPGNIVHAADATGIVVINQLRPISVLFSLSEDQLPRVRQSMRGGANPRVEAWSRDMKVRIATGRLAAVDNQIDAATGTVKLKAVFENKDGVLFPNLFVNVRLYL